MIYKELYQLVKEWVSQQMKPFTTIDLNNYLLKKNIKLSGQLMGRLIKDLKTENLINQSGVIKLKNKRNQLTEYKLWISLNYRLKQQKNASKDNKGLTFDF